MRIVETFPSTHNYYLHDLKYDFYGERIASCSSDHHIKVWDKVDVATSSNNSSQSPNTNNNLLNNHHYSENPSKSKTWKCVYDWKAHNGSIWKVEWAHPEFGQVLASCSYDHTVSIWEEPPANTGPGSGLAPLVISQGIIGQPSSSSNQSNSNSNNSNIPRVVSSTNIPNSSSSTSNAQNVGGSDGVDGNTSPVTNGVGGVSGGGGLDHSSSSGNLTSASSSSNNTMVGNVNMVNNSTVQNAPSSVNPHASRRSWLLKATLVDSTDDVVDIKFAPKHLGLKLATCSLSGKVRVYEAFDVMNLAHWSIGFDFEANNGGKIHCMSWCPYRFKEPMMVIGCEDGKLRIWHYTQNRKWQAWIPSQVIPNAQNITQLVGFTPGSTGLKPIIVNEGNIAQVIPLIGHAQPIHDVSWAPNLGRSYDLIASASKDGSVRIWKLNSETKSIELMDIDETHKHNSEVWKVEWNLSGTVLASSGDDGSVRLWKYNFEEKKWKCESVVEGAKKDH